MQFGTIMDLMRLHGLSTVGNELFNAFGYWMGMLHSMNLQVEVWIDSYCGKF